MCCVDVVIQCCMSVLTAIINLPCRVYRWIVDNYQYGCDRRDMRHLHTIFSDFMLPRLDYLIKNIDRSDYLPMRLNERGEVVGTLSLQEWREILIEIHYALQQDANPNKVSIDGQIPHNLLQVSEYLQNIEKHNERYKNGLLLLGRYYGDLWG